MNWLKKPVVIALSLAALSACVWMLLPAPRNRPIDRKISNVDWSGIGAWIAAGTAQGPVRISDGRPGTARGFIPLRRGPLNDLQFSPDERLLAVAGKDLILYPLEQPAAPRRLRSDGRNYGTVRFSRDGQTVKDRQFHAFGPIAFDQTHGTALMGSQDGRVYGWGLATRQLIALSPAHAEYVNTIAVSSAGLVAYAGFGGAVRLWNPRSGEERSLTAAHPTSNLVLGPDGASIVFGTADGAIEYWDTRGGQRLRAMRLP